MFEILLVDDSATDIEIMKEALDGSAVATRLHTARDADEAMAFLLRTGSFADAPRPHLILLDLHMPGRDGLEVLADIKGDPTLHGIPTVILTSSRDARDVARAYDLQANGYVEKPVDFDDFVAVMGGIELFWTNVAKVPLPDPMDPVRPATRSPPRRLARVPVAIRSGELGKQALGPTGGPPAKKQR